MMDWTDRHCRYFHRQLSRNALLFTEMVTSQAIVHGDQQRLLGFDAAEHPVALQLGGSDPLQLAQAALAGERFGYREINLNCGCPSDRVQSGAFGACLMREPALVADCVGAMRDAVAVPVTVKHRIGLEQNESYAFVRDFVGQVAQAGCTVFSVHARNAWLKGLSPKENRNLPPLRYEVVYQLKKDFPELTFILNGGLKSHEHALQSVGDLDGVMLGRAAYEDPWMLIQVDEYYRATGLIGHTEAVPESNASQLTRGDVVDAMVAYAGAQIADGVLLRHITRHMLGLCNGLPGARRWRRLLSDANALRDNDPFLIARAFDAVATAAI